ncbi:hypothetical protein E3N88_28688 [Mikania micrantha]|uniref:Helitron helicase-like domain-containing protein n=1 Tax=Mikania micrantha TaxID=192012 RepID=A0A5N6N1A9_9ASTR|nr:hypothetical protein E3N88_28688 [Mikania micrantha]
MAFLKINKPFGEVVAGTSPKSILLAVEVPIKFIQIRIKEPSEVDNYICAEIPDPNQEPQLYKIVSELMTHGPCGLLNPNSVCMSSGSCSKGFPKPYEDATNFDKQGHIHYRRRSSRFYIIKNGMNIYNGYVVPYNRTLLLHFMAHINVEYGGWSMLIKYLFKYISKGAGRIRYTIGKNPNVNDNLQPNNSSDIDEIHNYLDARFICPHEASWRIMNFVIHERNPAVQVLSVHLENVQNMTFRDNDDLHNIVSNNYARKTTLTEWLRNNCVDESGRHLRYIDYLSEYCNISKFM